MCGSLDERNFLNFKDEVTNSFFFAHYDFTLSKDYDFTLVVCFDYGKGTPSIGVNVGEAFWDGGPTINFFNAYSSTEGYHSLAYSECVAGKGADELIS